MIESCIAIGLAEEELDKPCICIGFHPGPTRARLVFTGVMA